MQLAARHAVALATRCNSITGELYREDPTILGWELADGVVGMHAASDYRHWVHHTATLLKQV